MSTKPQGRRELPSVAYFSMEIGLASGIPTYSGGLGVLAGDTLRAAADAGLPMVAVTLAHRSGYFLQQLDDRGNQTERPVRWTPETMLEALDTRVTIPIEGRPVRLGAWRYWIRGDGGHRIPVYLLDSGLPDNAPGDRALTDALYGGDERYRFAQETVLGLGGVAMLRALGHESFDVYHMNEGHSALLTLALVEERSEPDARGLDAVRRHCVFTTHTPVPAGHDSFPRDLVSTVLGPERSEFLFNSGCGFDGNLNMTYLGLFLSRYVNGVSMRHEDISRDLFPNYPINAVTNGVHARTWASPSMAALFDRHIAEWRHDSQYLRYAVGIPAAEITAAHAESKQALLREIQRRTGISLDPEVFTIGFARRATPYKRHGLLFSDLERLRRIARNVGPIQVVYAGKAHPRDQAGKSLIQEVFGAARALSGEIPVVYLEEYDMDLGRLLTSGSDLWLNTPHKPHEASGTSGMKAALNGVPSLSVLDGWWIEGHVEGVTGWAIGDDWRAESNSVEEVAALYDKLERKVLPMYKADPAGFAKIRRWAIALNGSFFNAQRMVAQYLKNAYWPR